MTTAPNRTTYTPFVLELWRRLRDSYRKRNKRRADDALEELLLDHAQAERRSRDPSVPLPPMQYPPEPPVPPV
jgi:hypothetical protein